MSIFKLIILIIIVIIFKYYYLFINFNNIVKYSLLADISINNVPGTLNNYLSNL